MYKIIDNIYLHASIYTSVYLYVNLFKYFKIFKYKIFFKNIKALLLGLLLSFYQRY